MTTLTVFEEAPVDTHARTHTRTYACTSTRARSNLNLLNLNHENNKCLIILETSQSMLTKFAENIVQAKV